MGIPFWHTPPKFIQFFSGFTTLLFVSFFFCWIFCIVYYIILSVIDFWFVRPRLNSFSVKSLLTSLMIKFSLAFHWHVLWQLLLHQYFSVHTKKSYPSQKWHTRDCRESLHHSGASIDILTLHELCNDGKRKYFFHLMFWTITV